MHGPRFAGRATTPVAVDQTKRRLTPDSDAAKLIGGSLAGSLVLRELVRQLLAFVQARHPGALNRADVNKHILAAVVRLNEAITLLGVEPLHGSSAHALSFRLTRVRRCPCRQCRWSKFRKSSSVRLRASPPAWPSRS